MFYSVKSLKSQEVADKELAKFWYGLNSERLQFLLFFFFKEQL